MKDQNQNLPLIGFLEFVLDLLPREKELCVEHGAKVIRDTLQNEISTVSEFQ